MARAMSQSRLRTNKFLPRLQNGDIFVPSVDLCRDHASGLYPVVKLNHIELRLRFVQNPPGPPPPITLWQGSRPRGPWSSESNLQPPHSPPLSFQHGGEAQWRNYIFNLMSLSENVTKLQMSPDVEIKNPTWLNQSLSLRLVLRTGYRKQ